MSDLVDRLRKVLAEKDVQIEELKDCLRYIVNMESCLLAHAQEVAQNTLDKYTEQKPVEPLFGDPGFPKVNHE